MFLRIFLNAVDFMHNAAVALYHIAEEIPLLQVFPLIHMVEIGFFIVFGYDFQEIVTYMEKETEIPENGNVYVASVPEMEKTEIYGEVQNNLYGGMPIQIGYCNGKNSTYNGFEYHKGSEINIAVTDFMLVLGHTFLIAKDGTYKIEDATVFFVPKGTAIEMFQTTLHLSPCRVTDEGFKGIVILPRGTNTPLEKKPDNKEGENKLLLQKNWILSLLIP